MVVEQFEGAQNLLMATKKGIIKKTPLAAYDNIRQTGIIAIGLREDDELIDVDMTDGKREIIMISKNGHSIRFNEEEVTPTGRSAMGVRGMRLTEGDEVITLALDVQGETILFATENGMGKQTKFEAFNAQHRGGKGVLCYKVNEKTGKLAAATAVNENDQIMLITNEGIVIRMPVDGIAKIGRNTSGVKLMNVSQGDDIKVAGLARIPADWIEDETEDDAGVEAEAETGEETTEA